MREAYKEYIKEHPEELRGVYEAIRRSEGIKRERRERARAKVALIRKIREERLNGTRN